jgi:hypothetical protein
LRNRDRKHLNEKVGQAETVPKEAFMTFYKGVNKLKKGTSVGDI